ncbi:MAG: cob(I)yrinic acid a,c-diamide adenosyltransferase [Dehalococcoidia bacterium]
MYTRTGDTGETQLLFGGRVPKTDPRCEAYGTVDEANAALGMARALSQDARVKELIKQVQRELFTVGSELATDRKHYTTFKAHFQPVTPKMVDRLEGLMDELMAEVQLPPAFIIPGASPASAALDLARTLLRRAERRALELKGKDLLVNPEVLRYLNRLSDLVFVLARYEDRAMPLE